MGSFSLIHWLVFGVVAILLLGGGRFSSTMGDVAKGIKNFKKGMAEDDEPARPTVVTTAPGQIPGHVPGTVTTPIPTAAPAPVEVTRADPAVEVRRDDR